jgi:hypothetical protein
MRSLQTLSPVSGVKNSGSPAMMSRHAWASSALPVRRCHPVDSATLVILSKVRARLKGNSRPAVTRHQLLPGERRFPLREQDSFPE